MHLTLSEALAERGYDTLTPVQQAVADPALAEADLLVSAQTGSGKTVGFGLAIAPTLLGEDGRFGYAATPLALIVAPTRELALQVCRELEWLYARTGVRMASCIGGMDARAERRALDRGAHIVVGTPGRLRDHIERGALALEGLRAVVLDEADEMLDLGFREDLEFMLGKAPSDRRTLLFSATVPPAIARLAEGYQRDAKRITTLTDTRQHSDIAYHAILVGPQDSEGAVINLLRFHDSENAIVFANTRASVARLTARLSNRGFAVVSLSGELSQNERSHALQAMRDGRARVCVATDVAARGIDLPNLDLVIHAELPTSTEALLHRSGRTGRAGRKGTSALIVTPREAKRVERVLKWAKVKAEWVDAPTAEAVLARDEERLLTDPMWTAETDDETRAFAARLLEKHGPEAVAQACLQLYRAGLSAPEELGSPDKRAPARERKSFDNAQWYKLSVGRSEGAEPRWLLPMVCRAGGIDRDSIGMIRMQQEETWVQLAADAVQSFEAGLGEGGALEKDVTAARMATPDVSNFSKPRGDKPAGKFKRKGGDFDGAKPRGSKGKFDGPKGKSDGPKGKFDGPKRKSDGPGGPRRPAREDGPDAPHRARKGPGAARSGIAPSGEQPPRRGGAKPVHTKKARPERFGE